MAKVQTVRLRKLGLIELVDARRGRGPAGTVFRVADFVLNQVKRDHQMGSNGIKRERQMGSSGPSSSSNSLNTPTTDSSPSRGDRSRLTKFQAACDRFGLSAHGIDANDFMKIWRTGLFEDESEILESAEHFAFYLTTESAQTIRSPKGMFIAELKKGYYAPPAGFESWEERQAQAKLQATQKRRRRLEELERQQVDAEFEVWLRELPQDRWSSLLRGTPWEGRRTITEPVRAFLRDAFKQERAGSSEPKE